MNHEITKSTGKIAAVLAVLFLVILAGKIEGTNSSFADRELSSDNSFTAGTWGLERSLTIQTENNLAPVPEVGEGEPALESTEALAVDGTADSLAPVPPSGDEVLPENPLLEAPASVLEEPASAKEVILEEIITEPPVEEIKEPESVTKPADVPAEETPPATDLAP